MKKLIVSLVIALLMVYHASAQNAIAPKDALKHIGEIVMVTGKVFSGKLIASNNMTLLDINGYNPNQDLTIVINSTDRPKFKGKPEDDFKGKEINVTGKIIAYKGKAEIIINDPGQIKIVMTDNIVPVPLMSKP
jgi:DNA/RNA endonuclease YhcR with UshA esterase domain